MNLTPDEIMTVGTALRAYAATLEATKKFHPHAEFAEVSRNRNETLARIASVQNKLGLEK